MNRIPIIAFLGLFVTGFLGSAEVPGVPQTPKRPVTDVYHGTKVVDPFRWLEDAKNAEVKKWTAAQNLHTRAFLDKLPDLAAIRKRLTKLNSGSSPDYFALQERGGKLFAVKSQPPKNQPFLITLNSPDKPDPERVLVDPNKHQCQGNDRD